MALPLCQLLKKNSFKEGYLHVLSAESTGDGSSRMDIALGAVRALGRLVLFLQGARRRIAALYRGSGPSRPGRAAAESIPRDSPRPHAEVTAVVGFVYRHGHPQQCRAVHADRLGRNTGVERAGLYPERH